MLDYGSCKFHLWKWIIKENRATMHKRDFHLIQVWSLQGFPKCPSHSIPLAFLSSNHWGSEHILVLLPHCFGLCFPESWLFSISWLRFCTNLLEIEASLPDVCGFSFTWSDCAIFSSVSFPEKQPKALNIRRNGKLYLVQNGAICLSLL